MHSRDYKSGLTFKDLKVLVVGGSISGADISCDISEYSAKKGTVIHCFRKPFWILKRYSTQNATNSTILIDWLFAGSREEAQKMATLSPENAIIEQNKMFLSICSEQQEIEELHIPPENMTQSLTFAVSDNYIKNVKEGRILPKKQKIIGYSLAKNISIN